MGKEDVYISGMLFSYKKEGTPIVWCNMDGLWWHDAMWNVRLRITNTLRYHLYMESKNKQKEFSWGWEKWVKGSKGINFELWIKWNVMYSMVTVVDNAVLHIWNLLKEWILKCSSHENKIIMYGVWC